MGQFAEIFLTWCRRGVDGFRCDAGYKVPAAWQYIVARVQQEYPETIFLLEGLGGAWEATEALLTEGGMQWAYSELFKTIRTTGAGYLDHSLEQSQPRRLSWCTTARRTITNGWRRGDGLVACCATGSARLTSVSGGFGFTCGVEWSATEKIRVHGSAGMNLGQPREPGPRTVAAQSVSRSDTLLFRRRDVTRLSPADSHCTRRCVNPRRARMKCWCWSIQMSSKLLSRSLGEPKHARFL